MAIQSGAWLPELLGYLSCSLHRPVQAGGRATLHEGLKSPPHLVLLLEGDLDIYVRHELGHDCQSVLYTAVHTLHAAPDEPDKSPPLVLHRCGPDYPDLPMSQAWPPQRPRLPKWI